MATRVRRQKGEKLMKKLIILLSLLMATSVYADEVDVFFIYATTSQVNSTRLNGNINNIINQVNGGLNNDNAKTSSGFRFYEVLGSNPSAGTQGRLVYNTSDDKFHVDNGAAFVEVVNVDLDDAYNNGSTITVDVADVHLNGNLSDQVLTVTQAANTGAMLLTNNGTNYGLKVEVVGVISGDDLGGIWIYSNAAQVNAGGVLLFVEQDNNSSSNDAVEIQNDGTGSSLCIDNNFTGSGLVVDSAGVQGTGKYSLVVTATASQVTTPLVRFNQDGAGSNQATLQLLQDGSGVIISGEGNENLSNAGIWTDRTSMFADKMDIVELTTPSYMDKLKTTKLYKYKKKCEIYGNRVEKIKNGKKVKEYPKTVKYKKSKDAKEYVGIILDDPTTAEELISRNQFGEINGKSGTQIAEFLLVVCKELIAKNEALEIRIEALEP